MSVKRVSTRVAVIAELAPWLGMVLGFGLAFGLYRGAGQEIAGNILLAVAMLCMVPCGVGWIISSQDIGWMLFASRIGTFFFGGLVTYMLHGATTESVWLDVMIIVAIAPAALHVLLVPPVSAFVLSRRR